MKRTNLVLDEELLKTATKMLGAKTYSATVNEALKEMVKQLNAQGIIPFFGSGQWEGDLPKMREDRISSRKKK